MVVRVTFLYTMCSVQLTCGEITISCFYYCCLLGRCMGIFLGLWQIECVLLFIVIHQKFTTFQVDEFPAGNDSCF